MTGKGSGNLGFRVLVEEVAGEKKSTGRNVNKTLTKRGPNYFLG